MSYMTRWATGVPTPVELAAIALPSGRKLSGRSSKEDRLVAPYRVRNGLLDRIFYHVEPEDEARVVRSDHEQGAIIVVDPDQRRDIRCFADPSCRDRFRLWHGRCCV